MTMIINAKKLHKDAKLPHRTHPQDSGADLFCLEDIELPPFTPIKIPTGIAVSLPENTSGLVWGKSSVETLGIKVLAGLIDSTYRGEIIVCMINLTNKKQQFSKGRKIAQLMVMPTFYPGFAETDNLEETKRGSGGFGSTGSH
jgi:dUTP pyrophosphatase